MVFKLRGFKNIVDVVRFEWPYIILIYYRYSCSSVQVVGVLAMYLRVQMCCEGFVTTLPCFKQKLNEIFENKLKTNNVLYYWLYVL